MREGSATSEGSVSSDDSVTSNDSVTKEGSATSESRVTRKGNVTSEGSAAGPSRSSLLLSYQSDIGSEVCRLPRILLLGWSQCTSEFSHLNSQSTKDYKPNSPISTFLLRPR